MSGGTRIALGAVALLAALALALSLAAPHVLPGLATAFASPFWRAKLSIESGALRSPAELLAENESLRQEVASLELTLSSSTAKVLMDQNEELLSLLGRSSTTPGIAGERFKLAAVLVRPASVPYDELILDLGLADGVSTSTMVYSAGRVLIGRVASVLPHASQAVLYTSPGERYDVLIGPDHIPATAIGQGGGQYEADVPHGSKIAQGDAVIDSTLHDRAFGTVVAIDASPSNPFDRVLFAPPVNIYGLRFVLVR